MVKSCVPFATGDKLHFGDHHEKNATWFRDLMPAYNLIALPIQRDATAGARLLDRSAASL